MEDEERTLAPTITAGQLVADRGLAVRLRLVAGEEGLGRAITHPRIQKSGLALAGHHHGIVPSRIQILGETELSYFEGLPAEARVASAHGFLALDLSCVVVTRGVDPPAELAREAAATGTPLCVSSERSSRTIGALHALLDDRLAPRTRLHGVLVDVFGVGILLTGPSAIGKSECAIELVLRGHRLVADDVVECDFRPPGMVFGQSPALLQHHVEVRGLGVLNLKDLFGVTAVRDRKRIDVIIRLLEWSDEVEYDRMGVDDRYADVLGVAVRELHVPVRPGRDMGSIVEIAARDELLRRAGHHSARAFFGRLEGLPVPRSPQGENESVCPPPVTAPSPPSSAPAPGAPPPEDVE